MRKKSLKRSLMIYFVVGLLLISLSFVLLIVSFLSVLQIKPTPTPNLGFTFEITSKIFTNTTTISFLLDVYVIAQIFIIYFMAKKFSKMVSKRVTTPVDRVTSGLQQIMSGNLKARLYFDTENEFLEIRNSFNYMAEKISQGERDKQAYEHERAQLFANIAHDLKTPITTITGYAQILESDVTTDKAIQKQYLQAIRLKSERMNELLDLLFDYTKLESNLPVQQLEAIDMTEVLREAVGLMYTEFEEAEMEIEIDIPAKPIMCMADKLEVLRAINNLLVNALRHNEPKTRILMKLEQQNEAVQIIVADTGAAIPSTMLNQLFKPFVLGDESRRSKGGSGLGLAIVEKLVHRNGGRVFLTPGYQGYTKAFVIAFKVIGWSKVSEKERDAGKMS